MGMRKLILRFSVRKRHKSMCFFRYAFHILSFCVKLITLFVTTLWANSVDDKQMIVVLLFSENRLSSFIQIVSISHERLHSGNNKKYFKLWPVVNVTSMLKFKQHS